MPARRRSSGDALCRAEGAVTTETENTRQLIAPELLFDAVEAELEAGREAVFTVTGKSMWPFIGHGRDQVVIAACSGDDLRIGDIILFYTPLTNYLLHRVTALRDNEFETTGDGNCFHDGWFPRDCVMAKVKTIIRDGRTINCGSVRWRFLFAVWRGLFPVRKPLLRMLKRLGRLKAEI